MNPAQTLTAELLDKLRRDARDAAEERDESVAHGRARLRDMVVQLREAGHPLGYDPASTSTPSFKIGDVKEFPFVTERGATTPGAGHLSASANQQFLEHMKEAVAKPDLTSRDAATGRAAQVVAKDWAHMHGHKSHTPEFLQQARAQVTFAAREIGQKLGLGPVESTAIGYSLERALEKQGFRVLASHAIDKSADVFRASISSVAGATGMRAQMESTLAKSMTWLAERGVTREVFKDAFAKHAGKISVLVEVAQNPEALRRAARLIAQSDSALHAVMAIGNDAELRKALGTITQSAGEALARGPGLAAAAGSVAIVAGAAMRGDSADEVGRHIFRSALTVLGGAAGGMAAGAVTGGFGSIAGGMAGAAIGTRLADKLLEVYDGYRAEHGHQRTQEHSIGKDELKQSTAVVVGRAEEKLAGAQRGFEERAAGGKQREAGHERELSMGTR